MLHILKVVSWYKTSENPIVGSFFEEQARSITAFGNKVGVLFPAFTPFSSHTSTMLSIIDDNGIPTYHLNYKAFFPKVRSLNYKLFCRKAAEVFELYIEQHGKPDVIHAHSVFYGGIVAKYISEKFGIPYVITEHLTDFITNDIKNDYDITISKKVFVSASRVIVVSNAFKADLTNKLGLDSDRITVIHNLVSSKFLRASIHSFDEQRPFTFFTNSFLTLRKNHELILRSFAKFHAKYINSVLIIGGDGPSLPSIKKLIGDLNISSYVDIKGELSREEVVNHMAESDVFLLASTYETFGVVLIEALAAGVPVVSTNCGGPSDIVRIEDGFLVNEFEVDDFAGAMEKLYLAYSSYEKEAIRRSCRERFSEEVISKQLFEMYQTVLK